MLFVRIGFASPPLVRWLNFLLLHRYSLRRIYSRVISQSTFETTPPPGRRILLYWFSLIPPCFSSFCLLIRTLYGRSSGRIRLVDVSHNTSLSKSTKSQVILTKFRPSGVDVDAYLLDIVLSIFSSF